LDNRELQTEEEIKFINDCVSYSSQFEMGGKGNFELKPEYLYPCIYDYNMDAGSMPTHYFSMDILVANLIIKSGCKEHLDVGSRIDGFVAHLLAAGVKVNEMDVRPLPAYIPGVGIPNINFVQGDATTMNGIEDESVVSLSSLHAVEHFGLGRYGDSVCPNACFDAMHSFERVLAKEGVLYFAVPVGNREKVCFNAHRIFSPYTIINEFTKLRLEKMYIIQGIQIYDFEPNAIMKFNAEELLGEYDCGVFVFRK